MINVRLLSVNSVGCKYNKRYGVV